MQDCWAVRQELYIQGADPSLSQPREQLQMAQALVAVSDHLHDLAKSPFEKSWGGQSPAIGMSEAMEHEADHRQGDHRFRDLL